MWREEEIESRQRGMGSKSLSSKSELKIKEKEWDEVRWVAHCRSLGFVSVLPTQSVLIGSAV